jgi:hypothetical protein
LVRIGLLLSIRLEGVLPLRKIMRYYQLENKICAMLLFELAAKIPLAK